MPKHSIEVHYAREGDGVHDNFGLISRLMEYSLVSNLVPCDEDEIPKIHINFENGNSSSYSFVDLKNPKVLERFEKELEKVSIERHSDYMRRKLF